MGDVYKDLQAAIIEMRSTSTGITDIFSSPSFDAFLGAPEEATTPLQGPTSQVEVLSTGMLEFLGMLRAMSWLYHHAHWQVKGDSFYGDHLMFQRIYEGIDEEIDQLAEKTAGYLGSDTLDPIHLLDISKRWLSSWEQDACPFRKTLKAEEDFQTYATEIYEKLKSSGVMTLGLDDFIMSLANTHDSYTYLIQQKLGFKESALGKRAKNIQSKRQRRVSADDLNNFHKAGGDLLIHKSDKDLWKLTKDAEGHDIIERLYEGDVLKY